MNSRSLRGAADSGTLLRGERMVLELIAIGAPLDSTLDALCRVIDEHSGLQSSIFLLDSAGERLSLAAGPNLPDPWRVAVASFPVTETACGAAVRSRHQIVSADMSIDPRYAGYHDAANAAGLRAMWSTPFFSKHGRPLGTFAVYADVIGPPSADNLLLVSRATHLASIAVERQQTEQGLRDSESLMRTVLDALPVGVSVVDVAGDIILSNPASGRIWGRVVRSGPERYATSKAWWHDTGHAIAPGEWASVRARANGETSAQVVDIQAFDGARKVIQNSASPIHDTNGHITGAVIVNEDISARTNAERERNDALAHLRGLTARLMHAQDDERRRIARMLHETTAQELAVLKMLLAGLLRSTHTLPDPVRGILDETVQVADRAITEARTLSYLLHPPSLDEAGLLSAVQWYARGFAQRSGIIVDLDLPPVITRLPQHVETTLFRIVQEALMNIHRHADSARARIRVCVEDHQLTLEIEDRGKGMSGPLVEQLQKGIGALGVGVSGMRERLKELDGVLDIGSSPQGTVVRAVIPLPPGPS
jgi:two-component system NarL family sensor kinase